MCARPYYQVEISKRTTLGCSVSLVRAARTDLLVEEAVEDCNEEALRETLFQSSTVTLPRPQSFACMQPLRGLPEILREYGRASIATYAVGLQCFCQGFINLSLQSEMENALLKISKTPLA